MTVKELSQEIYKRYGAVSRARGYFLYTKKGVRLTDMFLEDGRAILGWHTGSAFTQFKNYLSRGITGSFRTEERFRLEKAVSLLVGKKCRLLYFSQKKDAISASIQISKENSAVWKPFNSETEYKNFDSVLIAPPFPWTNSIFLLAVDAALYEKGAFKEFAGEVKFPFPLEASITRSIYDYLAELPRRTEKDWFLYDTFLNKYFVRKGCRLTPKIPEEKYDTFVLYCLENGLVINPHFSGESYVPFGVDKGNFTKIKNSPFEF